MFFRFRKASMGNAAMPAIRKSHIAENAIILASQSNPGMEPFDTCSLKQPLINYTRPALEDPLQNQCPVLNIHSIAAIDQLNRVATCWSDCMRLLCFAQCEWLCSAGEENPGNRDLAYAE